MTEKQKTENNKTKQKQILAQDQILFGFKLMYSYFFVFVSSIFVR